MRKSKSFTLIELIVVIFIIALLASIISVNLMSARKRGRDNKRKADVNSILMAYEMYYEKNGTYIVEDGPVTTGSGGIGWFSYETGDPGAYQISIAHGLVDAGFLPNILRDPQHTDAAVAPDYMVYAPASGIAKGICIYAKLEMPSDADTQQFDDLYQTPLNLTPLLKTLCNRVSPVDTYGMNYIVGHK
ncbi:MAG: type II secretion system protein [bacterium]